MLHLHLVHCATKQSLRTYCACHAAFVTLFTPFEYLADATSISTLFSFFLVATSLLWRRYHGQGGAEMGANPWLPAAHIKWLLISSIGKPSKPTC